MLVRDGESTVRQIRLSREAVRLVIAIVLLLVGGFSSALTRLSLNDRTASDHQLITTNRLLRSELAELNTRLDTLRTSLSELQQQDRKFRLVAGLDPVDHDVQQVGIGGPDADSLEAQPLWGHDRGSARQAFSTSGELNRLLRRAKLLAFSWREAEDTIRERTDRLESTPSIVPTVGYISSGFSRSRWHPILNRPRPHQGLDIVAPYGTAFVASARGRVRSVGNEGEFGLAIEIDHGYGVATRYAHASRALVRPGQLVERGDTIGRVGKSGLAVGPHLHYEVLVNGQPANPRRYIFNLNVIPD